MRACKSRPAGGRPNRRGVGATAKFCYPCSDCGEKFLVPTWHCRGCHHHPGEDGVSCNNCYKESEADQRAAIADPVALVTVIPAATAETPALPAPKRNTRVEVAREFKVPERKLRSIVEIEKSDPIAIDRIARGETTIIQERAKLNAAARAAVAERTPTVPTGQYSCIVIDPPWPMEKIEREVRPAVGPSPSAHHCGAGPRPGRRLPPVAGA
jgi:hypothetical protein